jgi:hypothetical protein
MNILHQLKDQKVNTCMEKVIQYQKIRGHSSPNSFFGLIGFSNSSSLSSKQEKSTFPIRSSSKLGENTPLSPKL